ncbi:lipopolysaccharide-induced tumor necrosis factor-alpha factor homolog [Schistocerca gregaria]|uniref:lipopolysaccharide-induced tumor necrosis factor-alpha factor homolog n=1 Tax=Schistocerca gregaria TaxID=7010 RepID=UPI00211DBDDC|nr:lipopolysaccharide-induced tumor necrosis factor-alpha factor homolog [Schistocerca gregaria]
MSAVSELETDEDEEFESEDEASPCERCCLPPNYFHHVSAGLGWEPQLITCPSCRSVITTRMHRTTTKRTWVIAAALLPIGCCWLPFYCGWYCMLRHYCPLCATMIGFAPRTRAGYRKDS